MLNYTYVCDFHREQAWERSVKERSDGLTDSDAEILLDLLRNCANATPNRNDSEGPRLTTIFNLS